MDAKEFREFGKAAVDYVADYLESLRERSYTDKLDLLCGCVLISILYARYFI
mgnify:CR=1 FL=1